MLALVCALAPARVGSRGGVRSCTACTGGARAAWAAGASGGLRRRYNGVRRRSCCRRRRCRRASCRCRNRRVDRRHRDRRYRHNHHATAAPCVRCSRAGTAELPPPPPLPPSCRRCRRVSSRRHRRRHTACGHSVRRQASSCRRRRARAACVAARLCAAAAASHRAAVAAVRRAAAAARRAAATTASPLTLHHNLGDAPHTAKAPSERTEQAGWADAWGTVRRRSGQCEPGGDTRLREVQYRRHIKIPRSAHVRCCSAHSHGLFLGGFSGVLWGGAFFGRLNGPESDNFTYCSQT